MKKLLSLLLAVSILLSAICITSVSASGVEDAIRARIDKLYELLGNTYFTTDRNSAGSAESRCLNANIIKQPWFQEMFGVTNLSVSQFPGSPRTYPEAYSCSGFASFAGWYIFKNSNSDSIRINKLDKMELTAENVLNYAKVGDIISLSGTKANGGTAGHEVIFISADETGMEVLDSNWGNSCKVTIHRINFSYCSHFQIGRVTTYNDVFYEEDYSGITNDDIYIDESHYNSATDVADSQMCGDNAYWNFSDGVLTISGSGMMVDYATPWDTPWYNFQSAITHIIIEEGITYIGNNAFSWHGAASYNAVNVDEIVIPSTVEGIGEYAFSYIWGVNTVYYNAKDCYFYGYALDPAINNFPKGTKLVLGTTVQSINANVCYGATFDEIVYVGGRDSIAIDLNGNEIFAEPTAEITVTVNGQKLTFDQPPILQNGRTLVPVRAACDAMGVGIQWFGTEQRIILTKNGKKFNMQIGSKEYLMNQISYGAFDVAPQIINNRTLLPIRAIAEFFGYDVGWDANTQTVLIQSR